MQTRFSIVASLSALTFASIGLVLPACGKNESGSAGGLLDGGDTGDSALPPGDSGTGVPARSGPIGKKCLDDNDCAKGLTCVTAQGSEFSGGPAGGVCTKDCSADADGTTDTCGAVDPHSVCVSFNTSGTIAYCLESCTIGDPPTGVVKCHGRTDMACYSDSTDGTGFCQPACRGDYDCEGRVCDMSMGICVDEADVVGTKPFGAVCDPAARTEQCRAGACIRVEGQGICSGLCSFGNIGCGDEPTADSMNGLCFLVSDQNVSVGDYGYCSKLCDCDAECGDPKLVCQGFEPDYPELVDYTLRHGSCTPRVTRDGTVVEGIPTCSGVDGGSDGGTSSPDGGSSNPDSGSSNPDSGSSNPDSGTSKPDSGSAADSGGAKDAASD